MITDLSSKLTRLITNFTRSLAVTAESTRAPTAVLEGGDEVKKFHERSNLTEGGTSEKKLGYNELHDC